MTRYFAYGKDTVAGCDCPAVRAGYQPGSGDASTGVAEWYDAIVRELGFRNADSILSEEKAKAAWLKTIERLEEENEVGVSTAREIAHDLGWVQEST